MNIFRKDRYLYLLILLPGIGGILSFNIMYYLKMSKNKQSTRILFKYFLYCVAIMVVIWFSFLYIFSVLIDIYYFKYFSIVTYLFIYWYINQSFIH
jgi:hypothetical protein